MEFVNHRRKMLDAMESNAKGNDDFATKVISTENTEGKIFSLNKNVEEVRRNNQTYFFFKSSLWATSLKVTSSEKLLMFLKF